MHTLLFFGAPLDDARGDSWYFEAEERLDALGDVELVFFGEAPSIRAALAACASVYTIEPGAAVPVGAPDEQEQAWSAHIAQAQRALGLPERASRWYVATAEEDE
jgi:hypothetical protein